jgi:hypothetical protein
MINQQDYQTQLNTVFELPLESGSLALKLIAVDSVTADTLENGQVDPFSAVFETEVAGSVEQGTYTLTHSEVGEITLFIVPIGPADSGMRYEAVFT